MISSLGIPGLDNVVTIVDEHPLVRRYRSHLQGHDGAVLIEILDASVAGSRRLEESHPGLLHTLAVGETDSGDCAVVWPLHETLAERLSAGGPMPWHRAASLMADVADAVDHAHSRSLYHGGIDTHCVMFDELRRPRLAGLGVADLRVDAFSAGEITAYATDPVFTAPEGRVHARADAAGDVYSLAAVLVACLAGGRVVCDTRQLSRDVPEAVRELIEACTAINADDRLATAAAFAKQLRTIVDAELYGDDEFDDDLDDDTDDPATGSSLLDEAVPTPAIEPQPAPVMPLGVDTDTEPEPEPEAALEPEPEAAPELEVLAAVERLPLPPPAGLDADEWYAVDEHNDWSESISAVMANEVNATPLDDTDVELLPGLDHVEDRGVITLADAERLADGHKREAAGFDGPLLTATEPAATRAPAPPVLVVDRGRVEIDEPVDGDVLVTGGQLVVRAELRGNLMLDGGRAVVFAPVTGDVINGGGTVSIEAPVTGRIRGQREFTSVRPGSQR